MRVIEIGSPGGPEVLRLAERRRPEPGGGEVLIQVEAAGVNRPDVMQRKGLYPPPPGASDIPGLEVAGRIVELGDSVPGLAIGDAVCALVTGGGYAEFCVAPAGQCLPIPDRLTSVEAASLPETFFTVWSNVFDRGALQPGESFLVQGGTSGIGVAAIQMARALGARVFATAGSAQKCAACVQLGAQRAIDYRNEDFVAVIKAETSGRGVDVILDMVGGDYLARETAALAEDGRLVLINTMGGSKTTVDLREVMIKRLTITGSTLRSRPAAFKAQIARKLREHVWPLFEVGRIKPVVYRSFPLEQAAAAHALMESGEHVGKIVLSVAG
jgi:NADPH2:quinone reductase